jgi:hypothetical protein
MTRRRSWLALLTLALATTPAIAMTATATAVPARQPAITGGGCDEFMCGTNHNQVQL